MDNAARCHQHRTDPGDNAIEVSEGEVVRHDAPDGEARDRRERRGDAARDAPAAGVGAQHRRRARRDRGEGAGDRRADLGEAVVADGAPRATRARLATSGAPSRMRRQKWRRQRRVFRPWQPLPGEHLVIDWTTEGGWQVFCAVLAWSRWRFVRVARDQKAVTTMRLLAECFEELGGVPKVVLADRMGCLKGGVVANVMVPTPDYVRFATHFGFRPDFCEAADPESKGVVEALCRYAQDAATGAATRLHGLKTPGHGRRPRYSDGVRRAEPGEGAGQEVPVRAARQGSPLDTANQG